MQINFVAEFDSGIAGFKCVECVPDAAGTVPGLQQVLAPKRGSQGACVGIQVQAFAIPPGHRRARETGSQLDPVLVYPASWD